MENATHLGLPWRLLREKLTKLTHETSSTVNYMSTLEMLDTDLIVSLVFKYLEI